jgi:4-amino-4-deoxy-L-arabinose transferase-like glycosyltransferase
MPANRLWLLVAGLSALPLLGWWTYGLFDLDEGFYAAISAEMLRRGEWITPYYNGSPWFEKPILLYWIGIPSLALFGEWIGPRVPSVLATLLTYGLVGWLGARRLGPASGAWAVIALSTSLLVVASGRMMLTDPLLVFAFTGAMLTFFESLMGNPRWRLATAFLLGLAVLAKGPVALVLFAVIGGIVFARERELRPRFRGYWPAGTLILAATVALWYLPAYLASPHQFVQEFLIEQNIGRFRGGDEAHQIPGLWANLLFYPVVLLAGMLPWSFIGIGKAFSRGGPRSAESTPVEVASPREYVFSTFRRYLWVWFLTVLVFFTVSGAKLPHYILPAAPAVALLVGDFLGTRRRPLAAWKLALAAAWALGLWAFAQWGFNTYYWGGRAFGTDLPGFHAEVHDLALVVRERLKPGDEVAVYQMPRRERELATGVRIQETSHPSLLLYLNRTVTEAETAEELLAPPGRVWVITRAGRIDEEELSAIERAGRRIEPVTTPTRQEMYRLWVIE